MDALTALTTRVSVPLVMDPGPNPGQIDTIVRAGLRAADHGRLRPSRFLLIEGAARERLAELFLDAALADNPAMDAAAREKLLGKPLRAPCILVAISRARTDIDKVPAVEQIIATGAAVQNMMTACHALGLGAMWRTGSMAYHSTVHEGLGLEADEHIVGFLYIGQVRGRPKDAPQLDPADYLKRWPSD